MAGRVQPVPEGLHTVTPRLVCDDAVAAIDFYREAFGAEANDAPHTGPGNKVVHGEVRATRSATSGC